jgi:hypothetical protein
MESKDNRASDLLLYVAIALGIVGVIAALVFFLSAHPEIDGDAVEIATSLFLVSLLMLGMLIRDYYDHEKTARFWWAISFVFIAQLVAGAVLQHLHLFQKGRDMRLVLIILFPEYLTYRVLIGALLQAKPKVYTTFTRNRRY